MLIWRASVFFDVQMVCLFNLRTCVSSNFAEAGRECVCNTAADPTPHNLRWGGGVGRFWNVWYQRPHTFIRMSYVPFCVVSIHVLNMEGYPS